MLGLIKKDLLMAKGNLKTILIILVVFLLMSLKETTDFSFIPAFISMMVMMTTFSYDEYNKSDAIIKTFPSGCRNSVCAKYIATIIIMLLSILLTFIVSILLGYHNHNLNIVAIFKSNVLCLTILTLIQSIIYPIIYKFGIEKSRIGIFCGVFFLTTLGSILVKNNIILNIPQEIIELCNNYWLYFGPLFILIVLSLSTFISINIYTKKEF